MTPQVRSGALAWLGTQTLLRVLPAAALKRLGSAISQVRYAKGETIYNELEHPRQLWILKEGRVRLLRHSSAGRVFAFPIATRGSVFCIAGLMNQCPYPCRAVADTDTVLFKITASAFHQLLKCYPAFGCEALKVVCQECCRAHALCSSSQERVEQRLLGALAQLFDEFGPMIPLGRQQVAELVGVSRETANRILLKLQAQGVVKLAFQRLVIRNPAKLRS
ncbi:MAG: Crp/Fnr family transcriptional regulator [Candidatus Omnitrophica bacterium]|nr:Crp/Fnr family transcriptional regulator [Candidatus Omnitrophota bacterium]